MKYNLGKPDITDVEKEYVLKVLEGPQLSRGSMIKEFEEKMAEYIGVKHCVAVNAGTAALHLAIRALGIGEGDEVITTPFSFIASANCILFEKAKPVFVDIDESTLNIDVNKIRKKITQNTKAILAVDVFGLPADWDELKEIANEYDLYLIEDSAEAIGAKYKDKMAGTFGDISILSFYPNKQITTGEGGMLLTDNDRFADFARSARNQGRIDAQVFVRLGYNYRMPEMNAALGLAQLSRIDEILAKRKQVAGWYDKELKKANGIRLYLEKQMVTMIRRERSLLLYIVFIKFERGRRYPDCRDYVMKKLLEKGIQCRPYFAPIHLQPLYRKMFGYKEGNFCITEMTAMMTLALPFYGDLTKDDVVQICDTLKGIMGEIE